MQHESCCGNLGPEVSRPDMVLVDYVSDYSWVDDHRRKLEMVKKEWFQAMCIHSADLASTHEVVVVLIRLAAMVFGH